MPRLMRREQSTSNHSGRVARFKSTLLRGSGQVGMEGTSIILDLDLDAITQIFDAQADVTRFHVREAVQDQVGASFVHRQFERLGTVVP